MACFHYLRLRSRPVVVIISPLRLSKQRYRYEASAKTDQAWLAFRAPHCRALPDYAGSERSEDGQRLARRPPPPPPPPPYHRHSWSEHDLLMDRHSTYKCCALPDSSTPDRTLVPGCEAEGALLCARFA
jgi:hypothetical protein